MKTLHLRIVPESKTVALLRAGDPAAGPHEAVWRIYSFGNLPADVNILFVEILNAAFDPPSPYTPDESF